MQGNLVTPQALRRQLAETAGTDGSWGYYRGKAGRIEPTCWAVMSLAATDRPAELTARLNMLTSRLQGRQRADGLLVEVPAAGPNFAWNGLALFALAALGGTDTPAASRLTSGLVAARGVQLSGDSREVKLDSRLQAWPWTEHTFSWVEPTAWCLLALRLAAGGAGFSPPGGGPAEAGPSVSQRTPAADARIRIAEAEALLLDRVCESGGWNYGNSRVFLQDLRPYVPTTALALLALQTLRGQAAVERSAVWLEEHSLTEPSSMALSLAAICLSVFGRPVDKILAKLAERAAQTEMLGNMHLVAMALYALTIPDHRVSFFRVKT